MSKANNLEILDKVLNTKTFGIVLLLLTPIFSALFVLMKKDWTWAIITICVVIVLLVVAYILSALTSKVTKDIVSDLVKQDGILDCYLKERIHEMTVQVSASGDCMSRVQKDCRKSIEQFFLKQYDEIKFFNIDDILLLEESVEKGEIWIITDELGTELDNKKVRDTILGNLQDGTIYRYFYSHNEKAIDAERRLKTTFRDTYKITTIDQQLFFQKVVSRYDALLKLSKDIVILNPTRQNRRAFMCIFANDTFDIAFYRELNTEETTQLSGMIENIDSSFSMVK